MELVKKEKKPLNYHIKNLEIKFSKSDYVTDLRSLNKTQLVSSLKVH